MKRAEDWVRFLCKYGPIARNGNMFDEDILRTSRRTGVSPIAFEHPLAERLYTCFDINSNDWKSVILTGTAGDGKTHLCRQVWERLDGDEAAWASDEQYLVADIQHPLKGHLRLHVIRDLSAWVPQTGMRWPSEKEELLLKFSRRLTNLDPSDPDPSDYFLIAGNDGQLMETWRRLSHWEAEEAYRLFERLLVEGREEDHGIALRFFNLSRLSSADLFDRALQALLSHEGWKACFEGEAGQSITFGPQSPIRKNYELLCNPLVQKRLKVLFELCDYNDLHVPIREILLVLANAILGHPDSGAYLMIPKDIARIIRAGTVSKASLYNNIFGGNLPPVRQDSIPVFSYLNLFRIGYETTNLIDNLLIFGDQDEHLRPYFDELIGSDSFYGADEAYRAAQRDYVEGTDEDEDQCRAFLAQLVAQRRALFFKIPEDKEDELHLWGLTVFRFAGEYRDKVVRNLKVGERVERPILSRLVKGLNRIWIGMLVDNDRDLFLATGLSFSNAKVSCILEERVSVTPRLGQKVKIVLEDGRPVLVVALSKDISCSFTLSLIRFEYLSRVAEGALPSSFSRECYEDVMSFKSQALAALAKRREQDEEEEARSSNLEFLLLRSVDEHGNPLEEPVEVLRG